MREILFKGKRADNGEWVEGAFSKYNWNILDERKEKPQIIIFSDNEDIDGLWCGVLPETVGQYTGLTDKNGRKIFEWDIVEGNSEYFTYTHPYGKVVYDGGQYLISFDDVLEDIECLGAWANDVEIIGNIYDNPELPEGS